MSRSGPDADAVYSQRGNPWEHRSGQLAQSPTDLRGRALAAIERTEGGTDLGRQVLAEMVERHRPEAQESTLAAQFVVATSDPAYTRAVDRLLLDPVHGHREFTTEELAAFQRAQGVMRALTVGDGTTSAGLLADVTIDPSWQLTSAGEIDPVRGLATVRTISGFKFRSVNTAGVTAHFRAEGVEVDDDTPTLGSVEITPERWDAYAEYSIESEQDVSVLRAQLAEAIRDGRDTLHADKWLNGAGVASNEPQGIVTAILASDGGTPDVTVDPATAEAFVVDDVYSTIEALPARFRPGAQWLLDLSTYHTVRRFVPAGSTTEAVLFSADESRLVGKPWHEATALRGTADINTGASADNVILVVGDFRRAYTIVDRVGLVLETVQHVLGTNRRPTGERGVFAFGRTSGGVTVLNGVRGLNVETTA